MNLNIQKISICSMPDLFEGSIKNTDIVNPVDFNNILKSTGLFFNLDDSKKEFEEYMESGELAETLEQKNHQLNTSLRNDSEKEKHDQIESNFITHPINENAIENEILDNEIINLIIYEINKIIKHNKSCERNLNSTLVLNTGSLSGEKINVIDKDDILSWIQKIEENEIKKESIHELEKVLKIISLHVKNKKQNNKINNENINLYEKLVDLKNKIEKNQIIFKKDEIEEKNNKLERYLENGKIETKNEQSYNGNDINKINIETKNKINKNNRSIIALKEAINVILINTDDKSKYTSDQKKDTINKMDSNLINIISLSKSHIDKKPALYENTINDDQNDYNKIGVKSALKNDDTIVIKNYSGGSENITYDQKQGMTTNQKEKNDRMESNSDSLIQNNKNKFNQTIDKQNINNNCNQIYIKNATEKNENVDQIQKVGIQNEVKTKSIPENVFYANNEALLMDPNEKKITNNNINERGKNDRIHFFSTSIKNTSNTNIHDNKAYELNMVKVPENEKKKTETNENEVTEKSINIERTNLKEKINDIESFADEKEKKGDSREESDIAMDFRTEKRNNTLKTIINQSEIENNENSGNINAIQDQKHSKESISNNIDKTVHEKIKDAGKSVVDQIIKKAVLEINQNKFDLKISIKPETLGAIKIQVISENEQMYAKITTETQSVKNIIEQNLEQFRSDLSKNGMIFDRIDVSIDQQGQFERFYERDEIEKHMKQYEKIYDQDDSEKKESNKKNDRIKYKNIESAVDYYA